MTATFFSLNRWSMYSLLQWPLAQPLHKLQEPLYYTPTSLNGHPSAMATFLCTQDNLIVRVSLRARKEGDGDPGKEVVSQLLVQLVSRRGATLLFSHLLLTILTL